MSGQSANPPAIPVLITRPQPQAGRLAAELAAALNDATPRARPILSPLMQTEFLSPDLPTGSWAALILTSEAAAEAARRLRKQSLSWPETAFCVGDRTARAAGALGFRPVSAGGTAQDLATLILSHPDSGPLLWLHGRDTACDLQAVLSAQGRRVIAVPAYVQTEIPLSAEALALLSQPGPVVVPVFSPRSALLLARALPPHPAAQLCPVAISPKALACLPKALQSRAIHAETPDGPAMIRAILRTIHGLAP